MARIIIDGIPCYQESCELDFTKPFLKEDGSGEIFLAKPGKCTKGTLTDGVSTYKEMIRSSDGSLIVVVKDPISGFSGPVQALAMTSRVFAYVRRTN